MGWNSLIETLDSRMAALLLLDGALVIYIEVCMELRK